MKDNEGKRKNIGIIVFFALFLFCSLYAFVYADSINEEETYGGILRLHVIANSNSTEDQTLKLKVRDEVLDMINQELVIETMKNHRDYSIEEATLTKKEVLTFVTENLTRINTAARKVIEGEGKAYEVSGSIENCYIPEKTYGDVVFPAGNYEALKIEIGEGKGDNWWCVLFPPLCIIDPEGDSLEALQITDDEVPVIKLKFKTLEKIENWIQQKDMSEDDVKITGGGAIR